MFQTTPFEHLFLIVSNVRPKLDYGGGLMVTVLEQVMISMKARLNFRFVNVIDQVFDELLNMCL